MDRRDFFKSLFLTSLLTPLLLASKNSNSAAELYLISDSPDQCLPPLLQELKTLGIVSGNSYSFLRPTQQQGPLSDGVRAHMTLTSSRLQKPALPSFALAREGKIWDLRTRTLRSLWTEMNHQAQSSRLTIASFHTRPAELISGKSVSLYKSGKKVKTVSLKQSSSHFLQTEEGQIKVCVKDGKAWVEESPCRHKICVNCPPAAYAGDRIICAPNQFLLSVDGPSSVDTIIG